jgi:hypothetical protein
MNSYNDCVFIETTALVDSIKSEYREILDEILSKYDKKVSSNYVKMEIKRGVIQNLVYLHNKIVMCREMSEVFSAISRLSSTPQRHKLGTALEAITEFFSSIERVTLQEMLDTSGDISHGDYLRRESSSFIRILIRIVWRRFEKIVDEDINPMSCFVDIEQPKFDNGVYDNSPRTCDKSQFECQIKNFFRENTHSFSRIRDDLQRLPEQSIDAETRNRIRSLKEIIRLLPFNSRKFSNKDGAKDCWRCGDAILAVLSPEGAHVLHRNPKHYDTICKSLNKQGIIY